MATEIAKFRTRDGWLVEILQGTMSGAEDIPDDRLYTVVSDSDMMVKHGYLEDRDYEEVVHEFMDLIRKYGEISSTEAPAIKLESNSFVDWVGMFRAWRHDYKVGGAQEKLSRLADLSRIFPTLTIEEVFRLMVGEPGRDFDELDDGIVIMKTKNYMELELAKEEDES